ncbi:hypothetical protein [Streptomyces sp. NPDC088246]|uniref:hypothetical protein n=1 Tax=Streptomyces sp. NPDC088246 TaxID=3365842 RepID=UPI003823E8DB
MADEKWWMGCKGDARVALARTEGFDPERLEPYGDIVTSRDREVLTAYRRRGSVPSFSPPNADLRRHAGQVVAQLRIAEAKLHGHYPQHALEELARLVATIAEHYASGKV